MRYRSILLIVLTFNLIFTFTACTEKYEDNYYQTSLPDRPLKQEDTSSDNLYEDIGDAIADYELVPISDYINGIKIDLKYATTDNFTKKKIYDFTEPYLRYGTVKKLKAVQNELKTKGYELIVYDAYRPTWAQDKLWEICPDPKYVSDPAKGYTNHCRGNTVDVTLVKTDGTSVKMPSKFDEFSELANRDYSDVTREQANNSQLLEDVMEKYGFKPYYSEWWHYTDYDTYDVVKE